jgi:predicted O-linked N-acetylglucosamine transferase (SPINDLY family)
MQDAERAATALDQEVARAKALHMGGQVAAAAAIYAEVLRRAPGHVEALHLSGIVALQTGRPDRAAELFAQAIARDPGVAKFHANRGAALRLVGDAAGALASLEEALRLTPGFPGAEAGRGAALLALGRTDEAVEALRRAVAADPADLEALNDLGGALRRQGEPAAALALLDRALAIAPGMAPAHLNRANALKDLQRHAEALAAAERAIALEPGRAAAQATRATILAAMGQGEAALAGYAAALALDPGLAEAEANRGAVLLDLDRPEEALAACRRAVELRPDLPHALGDLLHAKMLLCDWEGLAPLLARTEAAVLAGVPAAMPGVLVNASASRAAQLAAARLQAAGLGAPAVLAPRTSGHRLRVAYVSADFGHHPLAYLMADAVERHDRDRFEVFGVALRPWDASPFGQRVRAAFEHPLDASAMPDRALLDWARGQGIDAAIDLGGPTRHARPQLFARRLAPLQAGYLGYLGTTGLPAMDYLVADAVVVPPEHRAGYAERILELPHYQANGARPVGPAQRASRAEAGLPEQGFVFCCLNNSYKLTPDDVAAWMRILGRVPGSVLWLYAPEGVARANLRAAAAAAGIAADRLVFAAREGRETYLARLGAADLFLDTQPYNAGATASDALWMGVPVLTRLGETFAGRVAASVLRSAGLPELVASSQADYEALAVALATGPDRLAELRARLLAARATAPLFDATRFIRTWEAGLLAIRARQVAGLPPDHVVVPG